jgi:hypothetical protein
MSSGLRSAGSGPEAIGDGAVRRGYFFNSIALDTEPASIFQIDACVFLRFIEREEVASGNRITDARKKTYIENLNAVSPKQSLVENR